MIAYKINFAEEEWGRGLVGTKNMKGVANVTMPEEMAPIMRRAKTAVSKTFTSLFVRVLLAWDSGFQVS